MEFVEWIIILVMFILLLFREYFFSYFRKKGENIATKEDIKNITKKIEETKSSINLIYKNIEFVNNKENEILLNIFDNLTILFNEIFTFNFGDIYGPKENYIKEIKNYEKQFFKIITSIIIDYHHALVYVKDEKILELLGEIIKILLEIKTSFKKKFSGIKISGFQEICEFSKKSATDESINEKVENTNRKVEEYYKVINPLTKKLNKKYKEYINLLKKFFNKNIII